MARSTAFRRHYRRHFLVLMQIEYPNYPRVQNVYLLDYNFPFNLALKENPFILLNYLSENWDELKKYFKKTLYYETKSKRKIVYKYDKELDLKAEWFRGIQETSWISTTKSVEILSKSLIKCSILLIFNS